MWRGWGGCCCVEVRLIEVEVVEEEEREEEEGDCAVRLSGVSLELEGLLDEGEA